MFESILFILLGMCITFSIAMVAVYWHQQKGVLDRLRKLDKSSSSPMWTYSKRGEYMPEEDDSAPKTK